MKTNATETTANNSNGVSHPDPKLIPGTNIVRLKYPRLKISLMMKFNKTSKNAMTKALAGKKLSPTQLHELKSMYEMGKDFPIIPKLIKLQLVESYEKQLSDFIECEYYENTIEIRDIITELKS